MAFFDWIKRRKESAELRAIASKYGHDAIGSPGASMRHYQKLMELRNETGQGRERANGKTTPRRPPSWDR
jgi:hypothetical protein